MGGRKLWFRSSRTSMKARGGTPDPGFGNVEINRCHLLCTNAFIQWSQTIYLPKGRQSPSNLVKHPLHNFDNLVYQFASATSANHCRSAWANTAGNSLTSPTIK